MHSRHILLSKPLDHPWIRFAIVKTTSLMLKAALSPSAKILSESRGPSPPSHEVRAKDVPLAHVPDPVATVQGDPPILNSKN